MASDQEAVKSELAFNEDLWESFLRFASEGEAQRIVVHLSDLHSAIGPLREAIARLLQVDHNDRQAVRRALIAIDTQLYEHLAAHVEQLRDPLRDLVRRLYDGE